jgi:nucleotide-binding universal stress UspA family protein
MKQKPILLASHGTPGARTAEAHAIALCAESGAALHHLVVVPDFWKGMLGDDWLNNAATQIRFGRYVETQLEREVVADAARLRRAAEARNVAYSGTVMQGRPADCLVEASRAADYRLAVIGAPRPKGAPGLRSRMDLDVVARGLAVPLLIVPFPR